MSDEIKRATQLLNYVCANRKNLLEREIHILPSSLKITINRHSDEKFKDTELLLDSILSGAIAKPANAQSFASENSVVDILQDQTESFNSFELSAAALRKFSIGFANYTDSG